MSDLNPIPRLSMEEIIQEILKAGLPINHDMAIHFARERVRIARKELTDAQIVLYNLQEERERRGYTVTEDSGRVG